ncbi:MAG TPA: hypothetical protein VNO79_17100, partial [Actinomycetota bacterium]|nr:hypothetical protein [Actinomycetota bacterium]
PPVEVALLVPPGREDVVARLYREGEVLAAEPGERGTFVRARVGERLLPEVRELVVEPARARVRGR